MKDFANKYNFKHTTSSPHYSQSNGMAERMVKTAKSLLEKSADLYLAYSPTEPLHCPGVDSAVVDGQTTEDRHSSSSEYPDTGMALCHNIF